MEALIVADRFTGTLQKHFALIRDSVDNEKYCFPNTDEGSQGYIDVPQYAKEESKGVGSRAKSLALTTPAK